MRSLNELISYYKLLKNEVLSFKNCIDIDENKLDVYNFLEYGDEDRYEIKSRFLSELIRHSHIIPAGIIRCEECNNEVPMIFWKTYHNPNIQLLDGFNTGLACEECGHWIGLDNDYNIYHESSEDMLYYIPDDFIKILEYTLSDENLEDLNYIIKMNEFEKVK